MNDTTRRYPRTLEQAFGPGHRTLDDADEPVSGIGSELLHWLQLAAIAMAVTGCTALVAVLMAGWIFGGAA